MQGYSLPNIPTEERYYLNGILIWYILGDLVTTLVGLLYFNLQEQNPFMKLLATQENWLLLAVMIKIVFVLVAYSLYLKNFGLGPLKILYYYGLCTTILNTIGIVMTL